MCKQTTVTIHNTFHNTQARFVRPPSGRVSIGVWRRVERDLCGMDGCICMFRKHYTTIPADLDIYEDYDRNGRYVQVDYAERG